MKCYFYLSKKNINKKKQCPVVCRISNGIDRHDFRTGIFISPTEWDNQRGMPVNNNLTMYTRLTRILEAVYKVMADNCIHGAKYVYMQYLEATADKSKNILQVLDELIKHNAVTDQTQMKLSIVANQFNKANGAVTLNTVTLQHFSNLLDYYCKKRFAPTTIYKKFEDLRRIFRYAEAKKYIQVNYAALYKVPPAPRLKPVSLNVDEIDCMIRKVFIGRLERVRDLFLFQCYTGLSYKDIFNEQQHECRPLNLQTVGETIYLSGYREKTDVHYFLPWLPEAASIADKYCYDFGYISNQKYNEYLKEVQQACGITKSLKTHVGRKTFAQMMVDRGYSAESVSRMLGHTSFNMTQKHYARISNERIVNETLKLRA